MKEAVRINRICIYYFYDVHGVADRYVFHMLSALRLCCTQLAIVYNGTLTSKTEQDLMQASDFIFCQGQEMCSSVLAYQFALSCFEKCTLQEADEIILTDYTLMGPVYPLSSVFNTMKDAAVDFWGITAARTKCIHFSGQTTQEYLPSSFLVLRRCAADYLILHPWHIKRKSGGEEESGRFSDGLEITTALEECGFCWKAYVESAVFLQCSPNPLLYTPVKLIQEKKCPVFLRSIFFSNYKILHDDSLGNQGSDLMEYLQKYTNFDTGMIWEYILRTADMSAIQKVLGLCYIFSRLDATHVPHPQCALILHLYYEELFEPCYQYALSVPQADIYLTISDQSKRERLEKLFSDGPWHYVEIRVIPNRGRDVGALLTGCRDICSRYELVCFAHDKKAPHSENDLPGEDFARHCFENILGTPQYVINIFNLFYQQPKLGLLFPPPPNHANYAETIGNEWSTNFDTAWKLAKKIGLTVPVAENKEPVAPFGTMFWFRPAALAPLLALDWDYNAFPPEPLPADGTLLHAIERLYPYVAQQAGYFSAWCMTDSYASRYTINLNYLLQKERKRLYGNWGNLIFIRAKKRLKKYIPSSIWKFLKRWYIRLKGKN